MGWFDDLATRAQQSISNIGNDINSYVKNRVVDAVVKVGEPPQGNLSAAQIAAGATGSAPQVAAPAAAPQAIQNAAQASQIGNGYAKYIPLALAAGIAAIIFSRKSRG